MIDPKQYPAKNRAANTLSVLYVQVEHADGIAEFTPSALRQACQQQTLHDRSPIADVTSLLSGAPACLYRTNEIEVALTSDEICRLVRGRLNDREVQILARQFGIFRDLTQYANTTGHDA